MVRTTRVKTSNLTANQMLHINKQLHRVTLALGSCLAIHEIMDLVSMGLDQSQ